MAPPQGRYLHPADIAVIVVYLVGSLCLGIWTICKAKTNIQGFFLAGRSMVWWPVGMSLFASNIGSVNYVGIAGDAAASGFAVIMFEWSAVVLLVLLGWVFLPVYIASGIYTMPEYLHWRFGGSRLRVYLGVVALATYIFATISSDLYSGAIFMQQSMGLNIYASVGILLAIALIFTALGGLETVIVTDALAVVVMVIGGLILCCMGFVEVGGYENLQHMYMRAIPDFTKENPNTTCGYPREDAFNIFRHIWKADFPWLGTLLRTTFGSLWYWCANQVLVQRALSAKTITHAKGGCILAGYLKFSPMFLMILPGMISRALYPNDVACADPETCMAACGSEVGCSNIALPKLVMELLPAGVRGLMIAAMIAAVVSTLTSVFNSASSIFTMDLWIKCRPHAGERELLMVGRLFVVCLTGVSIVWIPTMSGAQGGQIFQYSTTVTGYLGAPTCAMFILAMFWSRCNEEGAFWGLIVAQAWGMVRFILDMVYQKPLCGEEDNRPKFVANWHAHYHTSSQILLAFLVAAVISLATKPVPKERLAGVTYWTRFEKPLKDIEAERRAQEARNLIVEADMEVKVTELDAKVALEAASHLRLRTNSPGKIDEQYERIVIKHDPDDINAVHFITKQDLLKEKAHSLEKPDSEEGDPTTGVVQLTVRERFRQALCGQVKKADDDDSPDISEPTESHEDRLKILEESTFWKYFMAWNAIAMVMILAFMYGFFH